MFVIPLINPSGLFVSTIDCGVLVEDSALERSVGASSIPPPTWKRELGDMACLVSDPTNPLFCSVLFC